MSRQYWSELIWWATADATALANTTTEGVIVPNITIPANYLSDGRALRVTLSGKISGVTSATMQWATRWGGAAGVLLAQSELIGMGATFTNLVWRLQMEIQTRTNGATGALLVIGELQISLTASTAFDQAYGISGFDAPANSAAVDLTADTLFSQTGKWSAASASNTLTTMMYYGESLN
jgi:hypothetical protein